MNAGHGEGITVDLIPAISQFLGTGTKAVNTQRQELLLGLAGGISAGYLSRTYAGTTTAVIHYISEFAECPTISIIATWLWWIWNSAPTS